MSKTYSYGDEIVFTYKGKNYPYRVRDRYLADSTGTNCSIFHALGMSNSSEIDDFCSEAYGYRSIGGFFPECKYKDYEALTRVINAIKSACGMKGGVLAKRPKPEITYKANKGTCAITGKFGRLLNSYKKPYTSYPVTFRVLSISLEGYEMVLAGNSKPFEKNKVIVDTEKGYIKSDRTFGVELECFSKDDVSTNVMEYLLDRKFDIHGDGSVNGNGMEYVTCPLSGKKGEEALMIVCGQLRSSGFHVDDSCGTHVHIGIPEAIGSRISLATQAKLKNLLLFYTVFDRAIIALLPDYRLESDYCKPLDTVIGEGDIVKLKEKGRFDRYFYNADTAVEVNKKKKDRSYGYGRYYGINFCSLMYRGTLEIRYHQGTLNGQRLIEWTDLHAGIIDLVMSGGITEAEIESYRSISEGHLLLNKLLTLVKDYVNSETITTMKSRSSDVAREDRGYEESYRDCYDSYDEDDDCECDCGECDDCDRRNEDY